MKKITLFLLLLLPYSSFAQQKTSENPATLPLEQRLSDLDAFVEQVLKDWNAPGAGIAVVHKDKVIWAKGYGYRDLEKKLPVTPNTLFKIASNTKLFTATAIGMLVEEGKLEWDVPIRQFAPFVEFSSNELNQNVTIRDMLSHRTGLSRHDFIWMGSGLTARQLADRIRYMEPSLPFRHKFLYNNMMYETAGAIIEHLSGQSWQSFLEDRIIRPLGMKNTQPDFKKIGSFPDVMLGYYEAPTTDQLKTLLTQLEVESPAGSVLTSLTDASRWLITLMNSGKLDGRQVISASILKETMVPTTPLTEPPSDFPGLLTPVYGMGRTMASYRGHFFTLHGGALEAQYSQISFMPNDSIGVIAYVNVLHGRQIPSILTLAVYDRLLALPGENWHERLLANHLNQKKRLREASKSTPADQIAGTQPSHPLTEYAGAFTHPAYGTINISHQKDQLTFDFHSIRSPLTHYHYDRFQASWEEYGAKFSLLYETNALGELEKIRVPLDQQEVSFVREPDPRLSDLNYLRSLAGTYMINNSKTEIALKSGKLQIVFPGQPPYDLEPYKNNRFRIKQFSDRTVEFYQPSPQQSFEMKYRNGASETVMKKFLEETSRK